MSEIKAGTRVWCRTADDEWWETVAAGPATSNHGRPAWLAVPVRGWDPDNPDMVVNWPADAVSTSEPVRHGFNADERVAATYWNTAADEFVSPCLCGEEFAAGRAGDSLERLLRHLEQVSTEKYAAGGDS